MNHIKEMSTNLVLKLALADFFYGEFDKPYVENFDLCFFLVCFVQHHGHFIPFAFMSNMSKVWSSSEAVPEARDQIPSSGFEPVVLQQLRAWSLL